jgi:hypothetical protein
MRNWKYSQRNHWEWDEVRMGCIGGHTTIRNTMKKITEISSIKTCHVLTTGWSITPWKCMPIHEGECWASRSGRFVCTERSPDTRRIGDWTGLRVGLDMSRIKMRFLLAKSKVSLRVLGKWMYSPTHSLNSSLDGGEWSASGPGRFTPRKKAPGGPQSLSGRGGEERNS